MAERVDARDLKSLAPCECAGSNPAPGTKNFKRLAYMLTFLGLKSGKEWGNLVWVSGNIKRQQRLK